MPAGPPIAVPIAVDARYARAPLSGIGRHTLNLLHGLRELPDAEPVALLVNDQTQIDPALRDNPRFVTIDAPGSPTSPLAQRRLATRLHRRGVRLLHSPDAFGPLTGSAPRRVVTLADVIPLTCRAQLRRSRKARFVVLWRWWLKAQCRAADAVVTVSEHSADDIHRELAVPRDKIHVIPNSIPPIANGQGVRPAPTAPDPAPRILYVGRRDPYKNLVGLVHAFAHVHAQIPEATLVIVGEHDPRYPEPEQHAHTLGIDHAVRFAGFADDAKLETLYAEASLFAFPSLYEGFGLPPLEAMRHGVPVVASDRTCIPEVLGDAACFADPEDPAAFAAAMLRVLGDPTLAAELRDRGLRQVQQYTPAEQARRTRELWHQLLEADDVTSNAPPSAGG